MQHQLEKRLKDLRPGALFTTRSGYLAVKSEYSYEDGQCQCILLESGEYAHFPEGDMTPVREVELVEGQTVSSESEHEHTSFALAASSTAIARMCTGCGETWTLDYNDMTHQFSGIWYKVEDEYLREQFFQELRRYPLLLDWLAELGRRVEDVRTLSMNKQVIRDTKREAQEASGWHVQKLGETMTVSLVFADYSLETRDFKQEEWRRLTEPLDSNT